MGLTSRFRVGLGVALAATFALSGSPVSGFSSITSSGTYGDWGVQDNPQVGQEGARCFYNNGTGAGSLLERIKIGSPTIWGAHPKMTWVGWRFKILRSTDNWVTYTSIHKSRVWKDKASASTFADGFVAKNWYPPHGMTSAQLRVQVLLLWYKPGSQTTVEGRAAGIDDNYVEKFPNGTPNSTVPSCLTIEA